MNAAERAFIRFAIIVVTTLPVVEGLAQSGPLQPIPAQSAESRAQQVEAVLSGNPLKPVFEQQAVIVEQVYSDSELKAILGGDDGDVPAARREPERHIPMDGAAPLPVANVPAEIGTVVGQLQPFSDQSVEPASYQQPFTLSLARIGGLNLQDESVSDEVTDNDVQLPQQPFIILPSGTVIPLSLLPHANEIEDGNDFDGEMNESVVRREISVHEEIARNDAQITDAERQSRLELLARASNELQKNETYVENSQKYKLELAEFPSEYEDLEVQLATEISARPLQIPEDDDNAAASLQILLEDHRQRLHDERSKLNMVRHDIDIQRDRITEIPSIRSDTLDQLREVEERLATATHDDEVSTINHILLAARRLALANRLEMLDSEVKWQEWAGKVLPMRRDALLRRVKVIEEEVNTWQQAIANIKEEEIRRQAEQARQEAIAALPALKAIAERNHELTQQRIDITQKIRDVELEVNRVLNGIDDVEERLTTMRTRIEATEGATIGSGALLVENRRELLPPYESLARVREIKDELQALNLDVLHLQEEREPLAHTREFVEELIRGQQANGLSQQQFSEEAQRMTEAKRNYLNDLIADFDTYRGLLSDVANNHETLAARTWEAREYIDQHALWIQSSSPVSLNDVQPAMRGVAAFFAPAEWSKLGLELTDSLLHKPQRTALWVVSLLGLALFTNRIKPRSHRTIRQRPDAS
ncbi:MAG: hypothetical protein AAF456_00670 [Planctomycetota bacterium]